jgi:hypothetical protein
MATGWPMKTTYANGDVYSAGDVNDITGTINLLQTSTLSIASGKNSLINGDFSIWQRGTSIAIPANTSTYGADRWTSYRTATGSTVSRQLVNDLTNLATIQYCARVQRDSGNSSTAVIYYTQAIETVNTIPLANRGITYSFYARRGANYSATSNVLTSQITTGTGTDQAPYAGYTGSTVPISGSHTLTTTWQRFIVSGSMPNNATEMLIQFTSTPTGTAGAADFFEITGVQIEVGAYATTFSRAQGTIQGELAACQRYYIRYSASNTYSIFASSAYAISSTFGAGTFTFPVEMRTTPSAIDSSTLAFSKWDNTHYALTSPVLDGPTLTTKNAYVYGTISGATAGNVGYFGANNSTSAYIGFTAEL